MLKKIKKYKKDARRLHYLHSVGRKTSEGGDVKEALVELVHIIKKEQGNVKFYDQLIPYEKALEVDSVIPSRLAIDQNEIILKQAKELNEKETIKLTIKQLRSDKSNYITRSLSEIKRGQGKMYISMYLMYLFEKKPKIATAFYSNIGLKSFLENTELVSQCQTSDLSPLSYQENKLFTAVETSNSEAIYELSSMKVNLNRHNLNDYTALMMACIQGDERIVLDLISEDADVNLAGKNDTTPLMLASSCGHDSIVELLVKSGADMNAGDELGWSAFIYASHSGRESTLDVLKSLGADIFLADIGGYDAFVMACEDGELNIVKKLYDLKFDPNIVTFDGETPFTRAISEGHISVIKFLLDKAENNSISKKRFLRIVNKPNLTGIKALLLEAGALGKY